MVSFQSVNWADWRIVIVDKLGREFRKIRVSLTAACNYSCTYCVPHGAKRHAAKRELTTQELLRALKLICRLTPIEQVRITGGEPLIAPGFDAFISNLVNYDFQDVSLTTNGQFLKAKLPNIISAGIRRVNISLDTLDADDFSAICQGGDLASVLAGIDATRSRDLKIKINMVVLRRFNLDQILPMLDFCLERNIELRYLELMRMGHLSNRALFDLDFVGMPEILHKIAGHHSYVRTDAPYDSTAMRFAIPGRGFFGIIANESEPFCSSCTRLRLSSSGHLHGCLSSNERFYIADLLALPDDEALARMRESLSSALASKQDVFRGGETIMRVIGG